MKKDILFFLLILSSIRRHFQETTEAMLSELRQELHQELLNLKQDSTFTRNLSLSAVTIIAISFSIAEVYHHPTRIAKQAKFTQFSHTMSAGAVIKTFKFSPR